MPIYAASKRGYQAMWDAASITRKSRAQAATATVLAHKSTYVAAEKATGVPWWWIGGIHYREADCNPRGCLANGDPAVGTGRRTTHVPAGRGPYATFEESAKDAIAYERYTNPQWDQISYCAWAAEKFNGFGGGRNNSSYLWAGTSKEQPGMWVRDHVFDERATDPRVGVVAIWKTIFETDKDAKPKPPAPAGPVVIPAASTIAVGALMPDINFVIGAGLALAILGVRWALKHKENGMPSIFVNWKTTLAGAGALLTGAGTIATQLASGHVDPNLISIALTGLFTGLVGLTAKDSNVTGGTVKQ